MIYRLIDVQAAARALSTRSMTQPSAALLELEAGTAARSRGRSYLRHEFVRDLAGGHRLGARHLDVEHGIAADSWWRWRRCGQRFRLCGGQTREYPPKRSDVALFVGRRVGQQKRRAPRPRAARSSGRRRGRSMASGAPSRPGARATVSVGRSAGAIGAARGPRRRCPAGGGIASTPDAGWARGGCRTEDPRPSRRRSRRSAGFSPAPRSPPPRHRIRRPRTGQWPASTPTGSSTAWPLLEACGRVKSPPALAGNRESQPPSALSHRRPSAPDSRRLVRDAVTSAITYAASVRPLAQQLQCRGAVGAGRLTSLGFVGRPRFRPGIVARIERQLRRRRTVALARRHGSTAAFPWPNGIGASSVHAPATVPGGHGGFERSTATKSPHRRHAWQGAAQRTAPAQPGGAAAPRHRCGRRDGRRCRCRVPPCAS